MKNNYLDNFSYIFIPFSLEQTDQINDFYSCLADNDGWERVDDEIRYLHRYVSEKLTRRSNDENIAYHFHLNEEFAKNHNLYLGTEWYSTDPKRYKGQNDVCFDFLISDVELFVFNTGVGMLAFELRFESNDPFKIATAQYYLRKITAEKIHFSKGNSVSDKESFVDISKRILENSITTAEVDFFFYGSPGNERANFLTYIDVEQKDNYDEELYFLKWCYSDGFDFDDACCEDGSENYSASSNTTWGISGSAAVCLVRRTEKKKQFIENVFQKNFRKQYLLTYILLLHQKYTMYHFLTKMSVGIKGNLAELENYKLRLYEFETHYMFSLISEVPQYQMFYEKTKKAMALDAMFNDVQEPLAQLAEIQKQKSEKKQRDHEYRLNAALTTLSLLTVVSALTDATGITSNLAWLVSENVSKIIQLIALCTVAITSIILLCRLLFLKNKH